MCGGARESFSSNASKVRAGASAVLVGWFARWKVGEVSVGCVGPPASSSIFESLWIRDRETPVEGGEKWRCRSIVVARCNSLGCVGTQDGYMRDESVCRRCVLFGPSFGPAWMIMCDEVRSCLDCC